MARAEEEAAHEDEQGEEEERQTSPSVRLYLVPHWGSSMVREDSSTCRCPRASDPRFITRAPAHVINGTHEKKPRLHRTLEAKERKSCAHLSAVHLSASGRVLGRDSPQSAVAVTTHKHGCETAGTATSALVIKHMLCCSRTVCAWKGWWFAVCVALERKCARDDVEVGARVFIDAPTAAQQDSTSNSRGVSKRRASPVPAMRASACLVVVTSWAGTMRTQASAMVGPVMVLVALVHTCWPA